MRHIGGNGTSGVPKASKKTDSPHPNVIIEPPNWLFSKAPDEARPPRPLVPSRLDDDDYGDAPASPAMRAAAERGKLLHALFERVTGTASIDAAKAWLDVTVRDRAIDNAQLLNSVRMVIDTPEWAAFFGPEARAEVPLAALVGETVITGRIDRLVVEPGLVRFVDFKTGRSVPQDEDGVAIPYLRQMAYYAAALETIFPESRIEASLLFTHAPRLITFSDELLAAHKPAS